MSNLADDIKWVLSFKAMSSLSWNTTQQVPLAGILAVNRNVPVLEATEQAWLCPSGRDCYPFARDFVLYTSELEPPGCGESWRGSRMRLFSRIQMSPAISKDRAGTYTFYSLPRSSWIARWESRNLLTGKEEIRIWWALFLWVCFVSLQWGNWTRHSWIPSPVVRFQVLFQVQEKDLCWSFLYS